MTPHCTTPLNGSPTTRPVVRINAARAGDVTARVEIKFAVIAITIGSEQADPHSQVEGQMTGDTPVVLEIRFKDLIPVVELGLSTGLGKGRNAAHQKVGKGIARAHAAAGIKGVAPRSLQYPERPVRSFARLRNTLRIAGYVSRQPS